MRYWTKAPGTWGHLQNEEDFIVEEIPSPKFLTKFSRSSNGVVLVSGNTLFLLKKKNMTTRDALFIVAKQLSIPQTSIGFAGLKDKFAVTSQYITVKGDHEGFEKRFKSGYLILEKAGNTNKMMQIGELEGNKFSITLMGCKNPENAGKVITEIERRGLPNYFGSQRFGSRGDNHIIGRLLLQQNHDALQMINSRSGKKFKTLNDVNKKALKFFINAYQSFIFNCVLNSYISKNKKPYSKNMPIPGTGSKLGKDFASLEIKKILKKDKIDVSSFSIRSLGLSCSGALRKAFVKIDRIIYEIKGNSVSLDFTLPKGSYGTILLREVSKSPEFDLLQ